MGYLGIFGSVSERTITDKLSKIMWFSSSTEWFNYLIVKGTRVHSSADAQDIMILQHLMIKMVDENNLKVDWLLYPDIFARNIKWAIKWAGEQKDALIFKYKPTEEVKKAYAKYDDAKYEYKCSIADGGNDEAYNKMESAFRNLFRII